MTTKKELEEQIKNVKAEIEELNTLTNVGNMEAFDLIISKIKTDMIENVKEEDWKTLKQNKAKIEKMRSFTDYIENQTQVIEDKENDLTDLQYQLDNYQMGLFDEDEEPEETDINYQEQGLLTGDVFGINGTQESYLLVVRSKEIEGKFALIANELFDDERLLQYPANLSLLDESTFIGNIISSPDDKVLLDIAGLFQDTNKN